MFSLVFFSTSSHQLPPRAHRPHGLKAEAIAIEKWGIATDRLKKIQIRALGSWWLPIWLLVL